MLPNKTPALLNDALTLSLRDIAHDGFTRKRALNRELAEAQRDNPGLDFQTFVAQRQKAL